MISDFPQNIRTISFFQIIFWNRIWTTSQLRFEFEKSFAYACVKWNLSNVNARWDYPFKSNESSEQGNNDFILENETNIFKIMKDRWKCRFLFQIQFYSSNKLTKERKDDWIWKCSKNYYPDWWNNCAYVEIGFSVSVFF